MKGLILILLVMTLFILATHNHNLTHLNNKENLRLFNTADVISKDIDFNSRVNGVYSMATVGKIMQNLHNNEVFNIKKHSKFVKAALQRITLRYPLGMADRYVRLLNNNLIDRNSVVTDIIKKDSLEKSVLIVNWYNKYLGRDPTLTEFQIQLDKMWVLGSMIKTEAEISKLPEAKFRKGVQRLFFKYTKRRILPREYKYFYSLWKDKYDPITLDAIERILRNVTPGERNDYIETVWNDPQKVRPFVQNPVKTVWTNRSGDMVTTQVYTRQQRHPLPNSEQDYEIISNKTPTYPYNESNYT